MVVLLSNGRAFFVLRGVVMRASDLVFERDYPSFPEFARWGLPLDLVHADVLLELQAMRTDAGIPIWPSPVPGGWARTSGSSTSRHYAVGRLADAGDIFPQRGRLLELWVRAQERPNIGSLGLYSDTKGPDGKNWFMMHFDLRKGQRLFWVRELGTYYFLHSNPVGFWRAFKHFINSGG